MSGTEYEARIEAVLRAHAASAARLAVATEKAADAMRRCAAALERLETLALQEADDDDTNGARDN